MMKQFAVIDTETNWNDEVMSVGVVVADTESMEKIDNAYYIFDPEFRVGGMFSGELRLDDPMARVMGRGQALGEIREWLGAYEVRRLFAYNANFDRSHLPEYSEYEWYDIMRLAAYRQYNRGIPDCADCYKTGRLKRGYSVENILRMLGRGTRYRETHNAVVDAEDELEIMKLLGHSIEEYEIACLPKRRAAGIHRRTSYSK